MCIISIIRMPYLGDDEICDSMYIKSTKTHVDKNGNPRYSYRLVRSDRADHNIHQTTLR